MNLLICFFLIIIILLKMINSSTKFTNKIYYVYFTTFFETVPVSLAFVSESIAAVRRYSNFQKILKQKKPRILQ